MEHEERETDIKTTLTEQNDMIQTNAANIERKTGSNALEIKKTQKKLQLC
tara:strand:- start:125 stop:274 length:150 start_codon:yes stop_codon:yes gene_type:complete